MNTKLSTYKLIRYVVAYVFIISGMMIVLSPELGNFFISLEILPYPQYMMYLVAILEVLCGALIMVNKEVKNATIPLIIIMIGALLFAKIPMLHSGFFEFAFAARIDIVMLALLIILYRNPHR
ncbi:DoxX family protein [Ferdinandcohnia quinoae]|uniref:DoxX family membrane protein n=1 Tax=Fredinandcohnia quinoae TaxID=2918902 RepID=A0AAW5DUT0_9BACI|nr:DoxX family membrane protein [Fredinandcohnia sp. SECRCQ15]MCH1624098.1 DoxX family membrane protein [Fredinandcohnia sp. SECRCQ15]